MAAAQAAPRGKSAVLQLDQLQLDPQLQMRADGTDAMHAADLAAALKHRDKLPPPRVWEIEVVDDKESEATATAYFVTDGFHTIEGHRLAGKKAVQCRVFKGTWHDALLDAAAANQKHLAKKRSAEDKRRAVEMTIEAAPDWTSRRIAKHCAVAHSFVDNVREELASRPNVPQPAKRVSETGKTYPTARKKPRKAEASVESGDWRALPLAEFLKCGDDELIPTLERHKCLTAGDLAESVRTDRLPDGKKLGLWPALVQDMLRELEKLPGYDGPLPDGAASEDVPKVKAGAETVYQWREWDQHFGPLVRSLDAIKGTHPEEAKSEEFKRAKDLLTALANVAKRWRERLAKAGE
jgi:hypothetical protein